MAKIESITDIGYHQTYDLEVNHSDHQFYLYNGILTSNSHSVSYSYISFYTAWLRCHFPAEFMSAILNSEDGNSDKALEYISSCSALNIKITPPDINKSGGSYHPIGKDKIATGLAAVKGVGEKAVQDILSTQPFSSIEDFFYRTNGRIVSKTVIQSLAKCGAFESLGRTRKDIYENYSKYRTKVNNEKKKEKTVEQIMLPKYDEEWERKEFLLNERSVLGRTISGSLHEVFSGFFREGSNSTLLREVASLEKNDKIKIEVILSSKLKELTIKRGKKIGRKFAKYLIEDSEGSTAEMTVWDTDYEKYNSVLKDGIPIKAICKVDEYMDMKGLSLYSLESVLGQGS